MQDSEADPRGLDRREGNCEAGVTVETELRKAMRQLQAAPGAAYSTKGASQELTIVSALYGDVAKTGTRSAGK